jgi:hypothetical protein
MGVRVIDFAQLSESTESKPASCSWWPKVANRKMVEEAVQIYNTEWPLALKNKTPMLCIRFLFDYCRCKPIQD